MTDPVQLTIGVLARAAGVTVEAIRFYQRKGVLAQPKKPLGGIRHYTQDDVMRVRFIKSAQRLGFSLDEITELLRLEDGTHCREARALAESKLHSVRDKLDALTRLEGALSGLVQSCRAAKGNVSCPLIAALRTS